MKLIAGQCSLHPDHRAELKQLGEIPEVWGIRACGLKSVTSPRDFMGIDKDAYFNGGKYPSVEYAKEIEKMGKVVAFELMDLVQLEQYKNIKKLFVWNPAINQLGYPIYQTAKKAKEKGWYVGLKNPKWHGDAETQKEGVPLTNGEKNWWGNAKFAEYAGLEKDKIILIQRGVDIENKGNYRNVPVHRSSVRLKKLGYELWFDPSHTFGQLMRDEIVNRTIEAMKLKTEEGYLYSGILIEVGTSETDSYQHITIQELHTLIDELAKFREFVV